MLVDDDPLVGKVIGRVLENAGYEVLNARSVSAGLRALTSERVDLVVTDMYMPDEDGLDSLRQYRSARPGVPVIVMSGQLVGEFGTELRRIVLMLGAVATIGKTGNAANLVSLVQETLCVDKSNK